MLLPPEISSYERTPVGNHPAVLYRIVDLGTQQTDFKTEIKRQHKILLSWELHCDERMSDGRPFTFDKRYTYSSSDKSNLRQDLESWRGQPFTKEDFGRFDLKILLGKTCLINIINEERDGKTYTAMASISRPIKGMQIPPLESKPYCFDLSAYDPTIYGQLSQRLQETIAKSPEYHEALRKLNEASDQTAVFRGADNALDDEIPF